MCWIRSSIEPSSNVPRSSFLPSSSASSFTVLPKGLRSRSLERSPHQVAELALGARGIERLGRGEDAVQRSQASSSFTAGVDCAAPLRSGAPCRLLASAFAITKPPSRA